MQSIGDLKNTGLKATLPRITILELFQKSGQRHMSAEDVYRLVLKERADIGLATIYRVLMQFEQAGLLTRSQFESGKAVYELNEGQHHDHLVCVQCGHVEEFYDSEIKRYKTEKADIKLGAEKLEAEAKAWDEQSDREIHLHHRWAQATTALQVSIALAAIALLTRKDWLKKAMYAMGALGLGIGVAAALHV